MKLKVEGQTEGFESSSYGFESLLSSKFKIYKDDSNPLHSNLNPWIWSYEEQVKVIRIFKLRIPILSPKMKLKAEGQTKGFESYNYRFQSFLGKKFKFYIGDLNPLHSDLNPPFCRSIKCATCNSNNSIFECNLSHNGQLKLSNGH